MSQNKVTVIGGPSNFWLYSTRDGFDLTHPPSPESPPVFPRMTLQTATDPITIAPTKTALVIIDMQNYFLSSALGKVRGPGHDAEDMLLKYAIPAAREASIQIVWLNWGLTDEELNVMSPIELRAFGWELAKDDLFDLHDDGGIYKHQLDRTGSEASTASVKLKRSERQKSVNLGQLMGEVKLDDGKTVDAGRMLMRDSWNAALHPKLQTVFEDSLHLDKPDVWFHKNRISGFWEDTSPCQEFLKARGIKTLLFTGVNTDQCVLSSLQDAGMKGWATILLKDGCGTTSPACATQMVEFNCQKGLGFLSSCQSLAEGTKTIKYSL